MNLSGATHDAAARALKSAGDLVELVVLYSPEGPPSHHIILPTVYFTSFLIASGFCRKKKTGWRKADERMEELMKNSRIYLRECVCGHIRNG